MATKKQVEYWKSMVGKPNPNKGKVGIFKPNSGSFKKGEHNSFATEFKKGHVSPRKGKGKSSENKQLRGSLAWKIWRNKVFDRDNFTCQDCKVRGETIHPHHIVTVKNCIETKRIDLVFDVDNGQTLCVVCHLLRHKKKMGGVN